MEAVISYYYAHSSCGNVRFIAVPFGYGPRTAAENMAGQLGIEISDWKIYDGVLPNKEFKVLLNFGVPVTKNEPSAGFKVWIDCLMWLRSKVPDGVRDYDLFLAEKFFDTSAEIVNGGLPLMEISPLISNCEGLPENELAYNKNGPVLVSFGGIETPYTNDIHRYMVPQMVLRSIYKIGKEVGDRRKIICCCPLHIIEHLQKDKFLGGIEFLSLGHHDFLELLKRASVYVVQPGLYGPFEAFKYNIPVFFTTPFSYTQVCQAKKFDEFKLLGQVPLWREMEQEIGDLKGHFGEEQKTFFEKIRLWLSDNLNGHNAAESFACWGRSILMTGDKENTLARKRSIHFYKQAETQENISQTLLLNILENG